MTNKEIRINETKGDIIGVGIDGNGNIIGKDISIVIYQAHDYGLNLLSSSYFNDYRSTEQDLKDWKNGFSFKLEAIKQKMEYRRDIIDKIKEKLENEHRLIIVGESGTSKSTILMEIICEYFDNDYKVLYNFGEIEILNVIELVQFVEGLLNGNNRVLIAVDNVHNERTAAIFYIIDKLSNHHLSKNLLFVLTARLPEFDWFANDRLNTVNESYRESIRKFVQVSKYRYELEPFTMNEIEEFMKMYHDRGGITGSREKPSNLAAQIFDNTKGLPIMVKFYVFGKGLEEDVEDRYYRYLTYVPTAVEQQSDLTRIQAMLICALLDISNLPITDKILEKMGILNTAYDLENAVLYQYSEGLWKTLHPRWDIELLSFLYSGKNKSILLRRKEDLKKALDSIFKISDESITASTIQTLYDIASSKKIPINIVKSSTDMPDYLSSEIKFNLYLLAVVLTYRNLQMYAEMLSNCNRALELKPGDATALNAKALSLGLMGDYEEARKCCDEIIKIDRNDVGAWTNKGLALNGLRKYDEALECWKKAVEIDDNYVDKWNRLSTSSKELKGYDNSVLGRVLVIKLAGKALSYAFMKKYEQSLECSNRALELDENNSDNLNSRAWALNGLKRYEEALECSNKALEYDPNRAWTLTNQAWALNGLKRYEEALECSNKALELNVDTTNFSAWNNRAAALNGLKRYEEALECSNKALELSPLNDWTWFIKGLILNGLKRYEEALECSNKALELDLNNDWTWNNKAWALINLGNNEEELKCSNKALELDPRCAWAWNNKIIALNRLRRYDEASECSNKSSELDPTTIPNW